MREKPKILNTETLARTRIFHVEKLDLEFSNGTRVEYERLRSKSGGAVLVVPMLDEETVLMIREYAAGVGRYELALPKGRVEKDESLVDAANRELMEEIGYGANQLRQISSLTVAPGYMGHTTHVILAENLFERKLQGDEPEEIEVVPWKLSQIQELLTLDDCTEARSIAALFLVRDLYKEM
ncbi:MAG: ADP compounds hydrolase NudE [Gammaproteobacteria bacterium]